ncbi:glycosyltransferase family 1 protein [Mesorhizobium sp. CO1-1-11]|uniref:glycosyltransferase family 1 protein n=1 Tax=Mesorhizobium sp. CO1-1-11 TaxID=2876636 RepID=UPI001CCC0B16|nr:glycosyltransferase family 1 protein [Mesorhizobium sp. CO1-1-11]MBZ9727546.1 glycosyltransferase family 1 protein [Mesorhizobium sp. CO1-1-11]
MDIDLQRKNNHRLPQIRRSLLCFSHLRWNFVFQRPQHILTQASRCYDVFFFEEPIFTEETTAYQKSYTSTDGVTVVVPHIPRHLNGPQITRAQRKLVDGLVESLEATPALLWYYTPMALPLSRHISAELCVYDNMDELSSFRGAPPRMMALERELLRRADVVFTGGQSLYEAKQHRHRNIHPFPSSIDKAHFGKARLAGAPSLDQDRIPGPRLGFFGVIDERMDLDLVDRMAALRPDWQFVMIGPVVKIDPADLPRRPNVHWLGGRDYKQLPHYLSGWDVGIMPFARNESTQFISPTKTPEFLAAGVPVISTSVRDVVRPYGQLGLVEIADTAEKFIERAEHLLARPKDEWLRKVDRHLSGMSWRSTWQEMRSLITETREWRTSGPQAIHSSESSYV